MNAIAAHKNELRKLLENLSGDTAVSGITFVALLDTYITRLDANCSDISARITPNGDASWENEILARCEKGLTTIVKVRYEATP